MPLDLLTKDGDALFTGKLSNYRKDSLSIERIAGTLNFPILEKGRLVKVHGYTQDLEPFNLKARVVESNMVSCTLGDLELIPYINYRENIRHPVSTLAGFYSMEDTYLSWPQECEIRDISLGGACVISASTYEVGTPLKLRLELIKDGGHMTLRGKIVRAKKLEDGRSEYGFLFAQLRQTQVNYLNNDLQSLQKETEKKLLN